MPEPESGATAKRPGSRADGQGLPPAFRDRLARIVPPEHFAACWATFGGEPATAFRTNTLRTDTPDLLDELRADGLHPEPLSWLADVFLVPPDQRRPLTQTSAFAHGRLYVQNPSSMVPPLVLAPQPHEWVLDLTAAPGSKTLQLAALMGNAGRISAVESVRTRFHRLRRNLDQGGAANVTTYLKDGTRVGRTCPEWFDRVLLDSPCSSEGRFRCSDSSTYAYWGVRKIAEMARKQSRLLHSAALALKPGGTLVYSTCTFAPEENEVVIDRVLRRLPGRLRLQPIDVPAPATQPGLTRWEGHELDSSLELAVRILPDGVAEGFFVCRLEKVRSTAAT